MVEVTLAGAAGLQALAAAKTAAAAAKLAAANALSMAQNLSLAAIQAQKAQTNLQHYVYGTPVSALPPVVLPTNSSWQSPPVLTPGQSATAGQFRNPLNPFGSMGGPAYGTPPGAYGTPPGMYGQPTPLSVTRGIDENLLMGFCLSNHFCSKREGLSSFL